MATKDDINRLARSILRLRDDRIAQAEAQLTRLADDYRKLRQELLPVFKMAKERSEPLPYAPYQTASISPEIYQQDIVSPPTTAQSVPEKTSLTRTFSKKLGLSSTPKNNSPTHIPSTIHEGRQFGTENGLDPSAAASLASNSLTAQMSGGGMPHPSPGVPSPTSPLPYQHQPLAPRSYQREGSAISAIPRYDGTDDRQVTIERDRDPPTSAKSVSAKLNPSNSTISNASTLVPPREMSASVPPQLPSSAAGGHTRSEHNRDKENATSGGDAPSVEIFKSFRVGLDDPCYKVLPAALRKYNIQADWRQYALYIVYGDQERCVGLEEKPLALFKDLDREGKKPMFMLRKLANPIVGDMPQTAGIGVKPPLGSGGSINNGGVLNGGGGGGGQAGLRTLPAQNLPGGVL